MDTMVGMHVDPALDGNDLRTIQGCLKKGEYIPRALVYRVGLPRLLQEVGEWARKNPGTLGELAVKRVERGEFDEW